MATSNQRRRQAKEQHRRRRQDEARGPSARTRWHERAPLEQLIVAVAEEFAAKKADADMLVAELAALPGAVDALSKVVSRYWTHAREHGWTLDIGRHALLRLGTDHDAWLRNGRGCDVRTGIELLAWLMTLPPLPIVAAERLDPDSARMLERVRALLAKAESTEYVEEAESLTAKAQELISRHSLQHALADAASRERPGARHILLDDPYADAKALLVHAIADANRCRAIHVRTHGLATVLGFDSDLYATQILFTSLLVQATKAMTASGTTPGRRQPSFRRSFLAAFATRIGERLNAATSHVVDEVDDDRLLPVLAARRTDVEEAVEQAFPHLVAQSMNVTNHHGWASGRAAADLADLAGFDQVR